MRRLEVLVVVAALVAVSCSDSTSEQTSANTDSPTSSAEATSTTEASTATSSAPTTTAVAPASSTTSTPSSTTTPTTTTTVATTSTVPSSPQGPFAPPDPFVAPAATATGGGSGCSPGSGPLPDGVWFGYVDGTTDASIKFDLACYLSCDPGTGVQVRNENSRIRTLPVHGDAVVIGENPDGEDWQDSFGRWRTYDGVGLHDRVWVYVNELTATHLVRPVFPEGCRHSIVDIDWMTQLPEGGVVGFNDLGLVASAGIGAVESPFYRRSDSWQGGETLAGTARGRWEWPTVAASGTTVGIGEHVHRWTGNSWMSESFETLSNVVYALSSSGDRVLLGGIAGDDTVVHVLTWTDAGWDVETVTIGGYDYWQTPAGAISGDTFAVSAAYRDVVRVYDFDGATWKLTTTLDDQWDTGMWGSSLDLDGDRLLVGADGSTPGPGSRGGLYLYTRSGGNWVPEIVGEGGEGYGYYARIDGDTIVAGAAHTGDGTSFWVYVLTPGGWRGTPLRVDPANADPVNDWVRGVDVYQNLIAVSIANGIWIGTIR